MTGRRPLAGASSAKVLAVLAVVLLVATSCGGTDDASSDASVRSVPDLTAPGTVPEGPLPGDLQGAVEGLAAGGGVAPDAGSLEIVATSGDLRGSWVLLDVLRVEDDEGHRRQLVDALAGLTAASVPEGEDPWLFYADLLLAWDIPAPPGYAALKREVYDGADGETDPIFASRAELDWRGIQWSGVGYDDVAPLADPAMVGVDDGAWLTDGETVVGVEVGGEQRAFPLRVLEVHSLVTIAIGGRRLAVVHCAACGVTTAYFVDRLPADWGVLDLTPTGFVDRAAPLLVDRSSLAVVDGLTGAVAPSAGSGRTPIELEREAVVVTTWGSWRTAHPTTAVVSADAGVGRVYVPDPLGGAPTVVPSTPVGLVDPARPPDLEVFGVVAADGSPVAFDATEARAALDRGEEPSVGGVTVGREAGGLVATDTRTGRRLAAHLGYWFAWSGAHPGSVVWPEE